MAALASANTTAEEADARAVAALASASTIAEEASARAVAALASASTTAKEADARAVAALASAIICASSTVARTVLLRPQALYDVQSGRHDGRMQAKHRFAGQVSCVRETQAKTAGEMREGAAVGTRRMGRRCKEWEVG